jgi:hypothetical protein
MTVDVVNFNETTDYSNIISAINTKKTNSMSTNKILGRGTADTGAIEELTLGTGIELSGTTINITVSSGGDVTGPSSATADAVVLFNSTSGKIIKDSTKTIVTTLGADDTTIPTSKAVKDITDAKQNSIIVSATEPESPTEGLIWIQIA